MFGPGAADGAKGRAAALSPAAPGAAEGIGAAADGADMLRFSVLDRTKEQTGQNTTGRNTERRCGACDGKSTRETTERKKKTYKQREQSSFPRAQQ